MKIAIKRKKDEFFVITRKHVKHPKTQKMWGITHENVHKTQKDEFSVITLKHVNR